MSTTTHRRPGETFAGYTQLYVEACITCGVLFAYPQAMEEEMRRRGNFKIMAHCPNGHTQGYGTTPLEEARQQAKRAADRAASERARREQAEASARAQKAAATRARRERDKDRQRVKHGVCPCCKRTFKQLAAHMERKHPDYAEEAA